MEKAFKLFENNKYDETIERIESLDKTSWTPKTYLALARSYLETGNAEKAVNILQQQELLKQLDGNAWIAYYYELSCCYDELDDPDHAKEAIEKAVKLHPEFLEGWIKYAGYAVADQDIDLFTECLEHIKEIDEEVFNNLTQGGESTYAKYSPKEQKAVEKHITKLFGKYSVYTTPFEDEQIPVSVLYIPANKERNYATLVTVGAGAYRMNIPENLRQRIKFNRTELVAYLPKDADLQDQSSPYIWLPYTMAQISAMIQDNEGWLGVYHTISNGRPFCDSTGLSGVLLDYPFYSEEDECLCELPDGDNVTFLQLIPLYEEEMNCKNNLGAETLLEIMEDELGYSFYGTIDLNRPNTCEDYTHEVYSEEDILEE